jgi:hypothetical protein
MNHLIAIQFIQSHASPLELARLNFLFHDQPASTDVIAEFQAFQRQDGGFSPFWASDYSSLDATCFRLAQAQQLGISFDAPVIFAALCFLARRQRNGSWEEDSSIATQAPPW